MTRPYGFAASPVKGSSVADLLRNSSATEQLATMIQLLPTNRISAELQREILYWLRQPSPTGDLDTVPPKVLQLLRRLPPAAKALLVQQIRKLIEATPPDYRLGMQIVSYLNNSIKRSVVKARKQEIMKVEEIIAQVSPPSAESANTYTTRAVPSNYKDMLDV